MNQLRLGRFLEERLEDLGDDCCAEGVGFEGVAEDVDCWDVLAGVDDAGVVDQDVELSVGGFDVVFGGEDGLFVCHFELEEGDGALEVVGC